MNTVKCWEIFQCNKRACPAYGSKDLKCWLFSGTHCREAIQGKFLEKMEMCLDCEVLNANRDFNAMTDDPQCCQQAIQGIHQDYRGKG